MPKQKNDRQRITDDGAEYLCIRCEKNNDPDPYWPAEFFTKSKDNRYGLHSYCLTCQAEIQQERRRAQGVKARLPQAEYFISRTSAGVCYRCKRPAAPDRKYCEIHLNHRRQQWHNRKRMAPATMQ